MTTLDVQAAPSGPALEPTVGHWICCVDPTGRIALCGAIETEGGFSGPEDPDPDCVVCDELVDTDHCPLGLTCPPNDPPPGHGRTRCL